MSEGVQVTIFDPVTGETEKVDLSEVGYLVLTDPDKYEVSALQHYPTSGTVQLTLKRGKAGGKAKERTTRWQVISAVSHARAT